MEEDATISQAASLDDALDQMPTPHSKRSPAGDEVICSRAGMATELIPIRGVRNIPRSSGREPYEPARSLRS
ncbi:MAG: hypothetical protein HW416_3424 [Chloroflexi bacterium]|nr:hypothetical protein [Chloroflexota bacterium]